MDEGVEGEGVVLETKQRMRPLKEEERQVWGAGEKYKLPSRHADPEVLCETSEWPCPLDRLLPKS